MVHRILFVLALSATLGLTACESALWSEPEGSLSVQARTASEVLPADASFVGHLDVQSLRANDLFDRHPFAELAPGSWRAEAQARLGDFLQTTGFDLEQDVEEVYFAARMHEDGVDPSLVIYADFDPDRLAQYLDAEMGDALTRGTHRGARIYQGRQDGAFALVGGDLILVGASAASVREMIDRLEGRETALGSDPRLRSLLDQTAHADAWFIARDLDLGAMGGDAAELHRLGTAVRDMAFTVTFSDRDIEGEVLMMPREGVVASDLADLTEGMVALARTSLEDPAHRKVLDDVRVRTRGETVRLRFTVQHDLIASLR